MSIAQITKRKRGRPKGSKNKKHTSGPKYGDPEFPNRPPDRDLTVDEIHLLCAEWQRTRNVDKSAKAIGIDGARAYKIVAEFAAKHPEALEDPNVMLYAALEMWTIAGMSTDQAKANMEDIFGKTAVMTTWIARQKGDAYYKAWKEAMGASATEDPAKLKAQLEAVQDEIDRLDTTPAGQGAVAGTATEGTAEGTVAHDADVGQGQAEGTDDR